MKFTTFVQLQFKRLLKNRAFLLLLLCFPFLLYALSSAFQSEDDSRISVGICLATEDSLAVTLYDKLLSMDDSLFSFNDIASEDELLRLVKNGTLECGYFLHKDLGKELDKSRLKNLITVYASENTTCKGVLNELVYAALFEEYALSLFQSSLAIAGHLPMTPEASASFSLPAVTEDMIERYYRSHLEDGSTFHFDVQLVSASAPAEAYGTEVATLPLLRGFTALFLLLCGFLGLLTIVRDRQNGVYARVSQKRYFLLSRITLLVYLLLSGVVCLLGLALTGVTTAWGTELLSMLCYLLALFVFYTLLGALVRNHTVLCAAFPMLVLCTLVFTPVITDLSAFFPWMKGVRYVLPTYYYLLFF